MEDLTGRQLGPYQIVAPLGEGGMAAVFRAYQPGMERYVALKVLPRHFADDPEFSARFQREARILAQLQHPHILPVFDYGQVEGYSFIVMPFVPSGTLAESLQGQPLSLLRIRQVISQVGDALSYAHGRGLVHRDVKPSNVLIDERGNCLLTDFGLARMVEASVNLTASGTIMGTPAYMSPEQGAGRKIDSRSDIYSLGIILYEMATGRVPYRAETPVAVVFMHVSGPLPLPRSLNPDLPEAVERVILKALARDPDDRYQTAEDLVAALRRAIPETPTLAGKAEPRIEPKPKRVRGAPSPTLVALPDGQVIAPPAPKRRVPGWAWAVIVLGVGLVGLMAAGGVFLANRTKEPFASVVALVRPHATASALVPSLVAPPTSSAVPAGQTPTLDARCPGRRPSDPPYVCRQGSPLTGLREVSIDLGQTNVRSGLMQVDDQTADGLTAPANIGGKEARVTVTNGSEARYIYFEVDNAFLAGRHAAVSVTTEYFDQGMGNDYWFAVDYDAGGMACYKGTRPVQLTNSGIWKTATIDLPDAYFGGCERFQSDFRISTPDRDLYFNTVTLTKE